MANMAQAIRMALHMGETHHGVKDIFGEDVGAPLGGVFTCTQGLTSAWNSPLDERGIIGTAHGLALAGRRPVAEIQFSDYIYNTIDLLKLIGNTLWSSNGIFNVPLVVMTPSGSGIHGSVYHSHSFESMASLIPGWKIVYPSTPIEAYGLMISAILDPNPVLFLFPKALIRTQGSKRIPGEPEDAKVLSDMIDAPLGERKHWTPKWPNLDKSFHVPIGKAIHLNQGDDVTVVSFGRLAQASKSVCQSLASESIDVDLIDLRTIYPMDEEAIFESVRRTGKLLVVNEDTEISNIGEHVIRRTLDECFYHLSAPPKLLSGKHLPGTGLAWPLESEQIPQPSDIKAAIIDLHEKKA